MKERDIHKAMAILRREVSGWEVPVVTTVAETSWDPFKVLISCLLSLRTQDVTTGVAAERLFRLAGSPEEMAKLRASQIEKAIYPVGFYRTKARAILGICRDLVDKYQGRVPDEIEELLKLKGVGRKTANLVVTLGYGRPGICVDTHVHRISNRWGYVKTKTPEETEFSLRKKLPPEYWIEYNDLLVSFGQNICRPLSPKCSQCPVEGYCGKEGVGRRR